MSHEDPPTLVMNIESQSILIPTVKVEDISRVNVKVKSGIALVVTGPQKEPTEPALGKSEGVQYIYFQNTRVPS